MARLDAAWATFFGTPREWDHFWQGTPTANVVVQAVGHGGRARYPIQGYWPLPAVTAKPEDDPAEVERLAAAERARAVMAVAIHLAMTRYAANYDEEAEARLIGLL